MFKDICSFKECDVNEIIPKLWLGNYKSSLNHNFIYDNNIKFILRLHQNINFNVHDPNIIKTNIGYIYSKNNIIYYHIPIEDEFTCSLNIFELFDSTTKFIRTAIKLNKAILVHCKRGHHRSASVVAAYLIKYKIMNYKNAVEYINHLRKCALRRNTCMTRGLFDYYNYLNNSICNKQCRKVDTAFVCNCSY